jgi:hypothetical protein
VHSWQSWVETSPIEVAIGMNNAPVTGCGLKDKDPFDDRFLPGSAMSDKAGGD